MGADLGHFRMCRPPQIPGGPEGLNTMYGLGLRRPGPRRLAACRVGLVILLMTGTGLAHGAVGDCLPLLPEESAIARPATRPDVVQADFAGVEDESEVRYNGTPTPGARITLSLTGSDDTTATYLWTQVEGPAVEIDDPSKPRVSLTIPPGADRLRFLLTTKDRLGERTVKVTIPVAAAAAPADPSMPRSDAGDDQIGLAGRRITLNGSRSRTTSNKPGSYRWLQVDGPKVSQLVAQGPFLSFTPTSPGRYRFVLMVAGNDVISESDEVVVTVGEPPVTPSDDSVIKPYDRTLGLDASTAGALGLSGKPLADQIAEVFEAITDRVGLHSSLETLASEMARRLDSVIPRDPSARQLWSQGIFLPLSQRLAAELSGVGLDLRMPMAQQQPLTDLQKKRIRKVLQAYAQEFRSVARSR